ncbi:unnamed protein product [Linum trigynum]|uniref:Uncharacterized protein n=1 Tax=Linum trigynum TaxID=586398 RepID=A0AAV2D347_9ROSI
MPAATRHRWKGLFQSQQRPCFLQPFPSSSEERTPHLEIGFASQTCRFFPPLVIPNLRVRYGQRCFELEIAPMNNCNGSVDLLTNPNYISWLMKMESRQQEAMVSFPGYIQILGFCRATYISGIIGLMWLQTANNSLLFRLLRMRMAHRMDAHFEEVQVCPVPAFLMQLCFPSHKLEFQAENEKNYLALKNKLCEGSQVHQQGRRQL